MQILHLYFQLVRIPYMLLSGYSIISNDHFSWVVQILHITRISFFLDFFVGVLGCFGPEMIPKGFPDGHSDIPLLRDARYLTSCMSYEYHRKIIGIS